MCLNISIIFFQVIGVPVTLNGDLKNQFVETNIGFDTICKVNIRSVALDSENTCNFNFFCIGVEGWEEGVGGLYN